MSYAITLFIICNPPCSSISYSAYVAISFQTLHFSNWQCNITAAKVSYHTALRTPSWIEAGDALLWSLLRSSLFSSSSLIATNWLQIATAVHKLIPRVNTGRHNEFNFYERYTNHLEPKYKTSSNETPEHLDECRNPD